MRIISDYRGGILSLNKVTSFTIEKHIHTSYFENMPEIEVE